MIEFVKLLIKSPVTKYILLAVLVLGSYQAGIVSEKWKQKNKAAIIGNVVDSTKEQHDRGVGVINESFKEKQKEIQVASDELLENANRWGDLINDYGDSANRLPVFIVPRSEPVSTETTDNQCRTATEDRLYQAKLSREAIQFSQQEARRADYCAVQLIATKKRLKTVEDAVDAYNENLRSRAVTTDNLINILPK